MSFAASQPDAELIAIGEEMKPHIVNAFTLRQAADRLYEATDQRWTDTYREHRQELA